MPYIPDGYMVLDLHWAVTGDAEGAHCIVAHSIEADVLGGTVAAAANAWAQAWKVSGSNSCTLDSAIGYMGRGDDPPVTVPAVGLTPVVGTREAAAPINVTWLVAKNTGQGGRANKGRIFFPGVPNSAIAANGVHSLDRVTGLNTALESMRAGFAAGSPVVGVGPVYLLHSMNTSAPVEVTSLVTSTKAATQRRRLR